MSTSLLSAHRTAPWLLLGALLGVPSLASAQDDQARIVEANNKASQAFSGGDYEEAARQFRAAYLLQGNDVDPILIKNEAVALYLASRKEGVEERQAADFCSRAVASSNAFFKEANRLEQRSRERIAPIDYNEAIRVARDCRLVLAERDLKQDLLEPAQANLKGVEDSASTYPDAPLTSKQTDQLVALKRAIEERRQALAAAKKPLPPKIVRPEDPADEPWSTQEIVGWSMIGAGALGLGGFGLYFNGKQASFNEEREGLVINGRGAAADRCVSFERQGECDELIKRWKRTRNASYVAYGISGALIVGGITLVILDLMDDSAGQGDASGPVIAPSVGPDGAGVQLLMRW